MPWATQQMTNNDPSFALPITGQKNLFLKVSVVHKFRFQLQVIIIVKLITTATICKINWNSLHLILIFF